MICKKILSHSGEGSITFFINEIDQRVTFQFSMNMSMTNAETLELVEANELATPTNFDRFAPHALEKELGEDGAIELTS